MRIPFFIYLLITGSFFYGQSPEIPSIYYIKSDLHNDHTIDRLDVLYEGLSFFTAYRPWDASILNREFKTLQNADRQDLDRIRMDYQWNRNSKKAIIKRFYRHPSYLFLVNEERFHLGLNPVFHLEAGKESREEGIPYINSRGIELRGDIGNKIAFYSFLTDNQAGFRSYISEFADNHWGIVPHENNAKTFKDGLLFKNAYDFFSARGHISFRVLPEILIQFGQDRNFIGNGYRSLLLSDWSKDYIQLKIQTEVWKIKYTNLFAQLIDFQDKIADNLQPRKFMAAHFLDLALTPNLELGLFEAVVFGNTDSMQRTFDLYYLNPVIFYRSVEYALGSSDNIFIGANLKYNFLNRFQLYGQILFDEFRFYKLFQNTGWWANKFAVQAGWKYMNALGIRGLDLQLEHNRVRPYTYTHVSNAGSYTHFGQPLAHPLGANFKENIAIIRYRPTSRLSFYNRFIYAVKGEDSTGSNFGGDIFKSYETHPNDYGNRIGQGVATHLLNIEWIGSWQIAQNTFLDLSFNHRNYRSVIDANNRTSNYIGITFRMNSGIKDWGF